MKTVLLYYPFQLAEKPNSGSQLRPVEMLRAFEAWGKRENVRIELLAGTSEMRKIAFKKLEESGVLDSVWFCYMENQTIPLWLTDPNHIPKKPFVDRQVLTALKKRHIPVGVFYRDVYWKFDELYSLRGAKKALMQAIYRLEERFYGKYCNVIFLPSDAMGAYVDIKRPTQALPPGGKRRELKGDKPIQKPAKGLYVGGINNPDYGLPLLLDALQVANEESILCQLTIVCRPNEYEQLPAAEKQRLTAQGVNILHISGKELDDLYQEMDFAFIPRKKSTYNNFSVPVKLVEYLTNGLPVVATHCEAQADMIESDLFGLICQDEAYSMAESIREMAVCHPHFRQNIIESFFEKHSWEARVEQVKQSLIKEEL